ncbi:MAG: hypothetical protein ACK5JG_03025, partial [Pseudomonadota bacterium]
MAVTIDPAAALPKRADNADLRRVLPALGPVIPVIVVEDAAHALPLARALVAGGVRVLEVTLRTPAALAAVEAIARAAPEA